MVDELSAAILAGGQARRLGGVDKAALRLGGVAVIERQLATLRRVARHLLIVANHPERYGSLGPPVVPDLVRGGGALGGIYTAIVSAPTDQTIVVACDLPFLTAAFLRHLAVVGRDVDVAIPRTRDGYHPLCASYSRHASEPIRRRLDAGLLKVTDVLADADVRVREVGPEDVARFDPDAVLLFNVNTPDDYARAERLMGDHAEFRA